MVKCTRSQKKSEDPICVAKKFCKEKKDPDGFLKLFISKDIGYGVFANRDYGPSEFLLEYSGELLSIQEGKDRYSQYKASDGSFLFFYNDFCIDATSIESLGKYVNDSTSGKNCTMKPVYVEGDLHLCLFVLCDFTIKKGMELRYSYGDCKDLFWRRNKETLFPFIFEVVNGVPFVRLNEDVTLKEKNDVISKEDDTSREKKDVTPKEKEYVVLKEFVTSEEKEDIECKKLDDAMQARKKIKISIKTKKILHSENIFIWKDFVIKKKIGEGNFAEVFKATCLKSKSEVALRCLKGPELAAFSQKKLQIEAKNLLKLNHNNIVKCFGAVLERSAFVMEYCEFNIEVDGNMQVVHTLLGLLSTLGDDIPVTMQNQAVCDVASALQYLHDLDIIAGDLKPSNILVNLENDTITFKLADIYLCTSLTSAAASIFSTIQEKEKSPFTLLYIAPELLNQDDCSISRQTCSSDIYAFAIITYQIFFPEEDIEVFVTPVLFMKALSNGWRPKFPVSRSENIKEFIKKMWHENPAERPSASVIFNYFNNQSLILEESLDEVESVISQVSVVNDSGLQLENSLEVIDTSDDQSVVYEDTHRSSAILFNHPVIHQSDLDFLDGSEDEKEIDISLPNVLDISLNEKVTSENSTEESNQEIMKENETKQVTSENSTEESNQEIMKENETKQAPYKKPYRMCVFCKKMCSKLTNHIKICHKNDDIVRKILTMKKKSRDEEFKKLKRAGIVEYNKAEAQKDKPDYQGEKKRRKFHDLVMCSNCSSFISRRFFSDHRKRCSIKMDAPAIAIPMLEQNLLCTTNFSKEFITKVLAKIRTDELGSLVRSDDLILFLGFKQFNKNKHKTSKIETVRKTARSEMRLLANMYKTAKSCDGFSEFHGNIVDLFVRENFDQLAAAVEEISNGENEMKAGLRQTAYYLVIKSCKRLRDRFFIEKKEVISNEVDSFLKAVKSSEDIFLNSAQYLLEKNRLIKTRRPCQLPLEEDIKQLSIYISKRIVSLANEFTFWTSSTFIELRNVTMSRLTLLNGRRGGEVGRLFISEWKDAKQNGWINQEKLNKMREADKILVEALKMAYLAGKGKHVVSIIIPEDTQNAMEYLSRQDVREQAGVARDNIFLFASTQLSDVQFSGWHALKEVVGKMDLRKPDLINATNNRHRISTLYAGLDVPDTERDLFYKHMGHSAQMNRDVYQAPLALASATLVAPKLIDIENGTSPKENEPRKSDVLSRLRKRERKRPRLTRLKPFDDSDSGDSSDYEESEDAPEDFEQEQSSRRGNQISVTWTSERHALFMEKFGGYVNKTEPNPFPTRLEMDDFAKQLGEGFDQKKIRTKINNERKRLTNRTKKRLDNIMSI